MKASDLYDELRRGLPHSSGADRRQWASIMVEEDWEIERFMDLMFEEEGMASRFI